MTDYRELHRLEHRLKQVRNYLKDISPRVARYKELKAEEKGLVSEISATAI